MNTVNCMKLMSINFCSRNFINSARGIHKGHRNLSFVSSTVKTSNNLMTTASRSFNSCKILPASGTEIQASFGNMEFEGNNVAAAMEALANADAVCFDVDSTVIQEEGIVSYLKFVLMHNDVSFVFWC